MSGIAPRFDYAKNKLDESDAGTDPILLLENWWQEAVKANINSLDAVVLSTINQDGYPDSRIVLLKKFDNQGLVFFTNYKSNKAQQITNNPHIALNIFWPELEKQIRVRGLVAKTSRSESEEYFALRPRGAQIAAWASQQSQPVATRAELEENYLQIETKFKTQDKKAANNSEEEIPCPTHWGGFRLRPEYFEFWQGRANRLHDRIIFVRKDLVWERARLSP